MGKPKYPVTGFSLNQQTKDFIIELSQRQKITMSQVVMDAIEHYYKYNETI